MKVRKILYYVLWPVEVMAFMVGRSIQLAWMLIIVTNPVFLAIYLLNRQKRRRDEED